MSMKRLSQNSSEGLSKGGLISRRESSKFFEDESGINGGEDRFDNGWLEQPCTPPVLDLNFAHGEGRGLLTRDGHDEEIWACLMVGGAADDHSRAAFGG